MRSTHRCVVVGMAVSVIAVVTLLTWAPAGERTSMAGLSDPPVGHDPAGHGRPSPESQPTQERSTAQAPSAQENVMTLSPERLQAIGVKFELAKRRSLDRLIRTVGQVEIDERRLAHVNIKLEGWIDELFVNSTGERVKKGQDPLHALQSRAGRDPDGVSAGPQEPAHARRERLSRGRRAGEILLEVTHRRFQLWDITENHIQDLERTGKVLSTLPIHSPITGTVIKKVALAGMYVNPGDELYTIADLSHIWILADIYEYELPFVKVGQNGDGDPLLRSEHRAARDASASSIPPSIRRPGPPKCGSSSTTLTRSSSRRCMPTWN